MLDSATVATAEVDNIAVAASHRVTLTADCSTCYVTIYVTSPTS